MSNDKIMNVTVLEKMRVRIETVAINYTQPPDSNCLSSDDYQVLELTTEDAGGGDFYVLKSERWAFDDIDALINVIQDFKKRVELK